MQSVFLPGNTQGSRIILKRNTVGGGTRQRTRFACLKGWRRIVMRQNRCVHTFFSTILRLPLVFSSVMRPDTKTVGGTHIFYGQLSHADGAEMLFYQCFEYI